MDDLLLEVTEDSVLELDSVSTEIDDVAMSGRVKLKLKPGDTVQVTRRQAERPEGR